MKIKSDLNLAFSQGIRLRVTLKVEFNRSIKKGVVKI